MKNIKTLVALAFAGTVLAACGGNSKETSDSDTSTSTSMTDGTTADTTLADTSVKPADSTRSFRNDRGTDSVSAGKTIPAKP